MLKTFSKSFFQGMEKTIDFKILHMIPLNF